MEETAGKAAPLRAGAAQVDITPWAGVQLSGAVGMKRSAHLIGDPLFAKALLLESGGRRLCIVAVDLTIVTREITERIRRTVAKRFGLERDAVMVHATQTHSAPSLGHFMLSADFEGIPPECEWLRGGDARYDVFAEERILEAISRAHAALQPVRIGVGSGVEGRWAFNRRAVTRDGKVIMPGRRWSGPLGPTNIRYLEGPIDPEVGVLCLRSDSLAIPSMVVNYTCHPVHVFPKLIISADWPGALSEEIRKAHSGVPAGDGGECVPLVLNGACGNINPWPPFDPDYVENHRSMGRALAATVEKVLETLAFREDATLDWRTRILNIPLREIDPEQIAKARELLSEYPTPLWAKDREQTDFEWFMAAGLMDLDNLRRRSPEYEYEIQVFRVGDTAFVGLPGEPFVEGGLRIKLASPTYPTYIVHDVNHYAGYLPIKEAFARGGHEVATGNWSRFVPEALDIVVDAAVEMLHELFPDQKG